MDDKLSVSLGSPTSETCIATANDFVNSAMTAYSKSDNSIYDAFLNAEPFLTQSTCNVPIEIYPKTIFIGGYAAFRPEDIVDVQFYPKVVKMTFKNGTTTVAKLQDGDEYSKETGMMICIMEYIFQSKRYNNMFRKWIKHDEKRKADKIAAEKRAEEEKKIKERQAEKKARKKAARKEQKKKEAIEIQAEAIKQALGDLVLPECGEFKGSSEEISVTVTKSDEE